MANEQATTQAVPPAEAKPEKQANCLACSKPIKKLKRYYRDGKFYCTKACWKNYLIKLKEEKK